MVHLNSFQSGKQFSVIAIFEFLILTWKLWGTIGWQRRPWFFLNGFKIIMYGEAIANEWTEITWKKKKKN